MDYVSLMKKLDIPEEFSARVTNFINSTDLSEYSDELRLIRLPESRNEAFTSLTAKLTDDADGVKIFALEILAAADAYEEYQARGIDDKIYFDTMRAFRRQLGESYTESRGWIFDRGYWDTHQVSLQLFRIGELEYAFANKYGEDILAVHIPSNAKLSHESLDASFAAAREFFRKYYPEAGERRFTCGSWLLSAKLKNILGEDSKILLFQSKFHHERVLGGEGCLRWVFGIVGKQLSDIDKSALPEKTSLQREIKKLYLSGEALGEGYGIYKENDSTWNIRLGKYRHYKGGEYEVIAIGRNSETLEETVVYRALYGDGGVWVRPAYMWCQRVTKDGTAVPRFQYIGD